MWKVPKERSSGGKKFMFKPFFDIFAINPTFYLLGKNKTVTWIGCASSAVLICIVAGVMILYNVRYLRKSRF